MQTETLPLTHLLRAGGRNAIINLKVEGEKQTRPVMARVIQRDPLSGKILHVDFYQVSLKEKMRADVPVVLVGVAPAVDTFGGTLLQGVDTISVEALPTDIPSNVEVDVSALDQLESSVHVRDLAFPESVQVLTDPDVVLAKVAPPRLVAAEEEAVEAAPEEAIAEAEGAPAAAAEEEAPSEE